mgnify:CR=1 FL=1
MSRLRLALAGIGNCASALVQGLSFYAKRPSAAGLLHPRIGPYTVEEIDLVAAFDVDARKVGRSLEEAVFAEPNCTTVFERELKRSGVTVQMAPVHDGVADHMAELPPSRAFRVADAEPVDVAQALRAARADVLACYLPVGSEQAVKHLATCCLDAGVAFVNCVPVFIASNPEWAEEFTRRRVPIVGDDIKSQLGATVVHRMLARLMEQRGVRLLRTYQLNTGGNTDFLNMLERSRLQSKKRSKTESVQSQLGTRLPDEDIHVGPSDWVPWQLDNKVCFLRLEWAGFGEVPMNLEMRLSVEDSPNSAGVALDAIRCAKLAKDRGMGGPVLEASAWTMKSPPRQMTDEEARSALERWMAFAR